MKITSHLRVLGAESCCHQEYLCTAGDSDCLSQDNACCLSRLNFGFGLPLLGLLTKHLFRSANKQLFHILWNSVPIAGLSSLPITSLVPESCSLACVTRSARGDRGHLALDARLHGYPYRGDSPLRLIQMLQKKGPSLQLPAQLYFTHEHVGKDIALQWTSPEARNLLLGASQPIRLSELKEERRQ